jgi:hypothetical protein
MIQREAEHEFGFDLPSSAAGIEAPRRFFAYQLFTQDSYAIYTTFKVR